MDYLIVCTCCKAAYSKQKFLDLELLRGGNRSGGLVYRNCPCRNTLARPEEDFNIHQLRRYDSPNYALVEYYTIKDRHRERGMRAAARYLAK